MTPSSGTLPVEQVDRERADQPVDVEAIVAKLLDTEWSGKAQGKPVERGTSCWQRNPDGPEAVTAIRQLAAARDEARKIVRDVHWMARRYADGRRSYAVGMFNDAIRPAYEAGWVKPLDNGEPAYARDGDSNPEWTSLEQRLVVLEAARDAALSRVTEAERALGEARAENERLDGCLRYLASCQAATAEAVTKRTGKSERGRQARLCQMAMDMLDGGTAPRDAIGVMNRLCAARAILEQS